MKNLGGPRLDGMFVPRVSEMPDVSAASPGQLLHLTRDEPNPTQNRPWYGRGTYVFNGFSWTKLGESERQRKAEIIGAQTHEITASMTDRLPHYSQGIQLASLNLTLSSKRATVSGIGTVWVDHSKSANVWIAVFNGSRMVGMALTNVDPGKARSIAVTFYDVPATQGVVYMLRAYTDTAGVLSVNQTNKLTFDGAPSTAFIAEENN